jgi:hypothetical protein
MTPPLLTLLTLLTLFHCHSGILLLLQLLVVLSF